MNEDVMQFVEALVQACEEQKLVKCICSKKKNKSSEHPDKIEIQALKNKDRVLFISSFSKFQSKAQLTKEDLKLQLLDLLGVEYLNATLFTTEKEIQFLCNKKMNTKVLIQNITSDKEPSQRTKNYPIQANELWLQHLGITTAEGVVKDKMQSKYRQINRFVELLDHHIGDKAKDCKQWIDFGCGKSYLTFALHNYLTKKGTDYQLIGVEQNQVIIDTVSDIAKKLDISQLSFEYASIKEFDRIKNDSVLVALHACNTATDDVIVKGISTQAKALVLAPCCQHYVRKNKTKNGLLEPVLRYGIFDERMSSMLTDSLRMLVLQYYGYKVKCMEFVSDAHTAKNVLIIAVKHQQEKQEQFLGQINDLKEHFGLTDFYLDRELSLI